MAHPIVGDDMLLLFVGDSITDCGRRGAEAPLGNGYARMAAELMTARQPERRVRYLNKGISGNRVTDLEARWTDDVLYHRPDVMVMMIGINDLHSHLRGAEGAVDPVLFEKTYDGLMRRSREALQCDVTLLSPFFISRDRGGQSFRSQVLDLMPRYVEIVRRTAERYSARFVDLHALFARHLEHREAEVFCPEPVHPNHAGHMVIAQAVLDALGE